MRKIQVMLIMLIAVGLFAGSAFALVNQSFELATTVNGYSFPLGWDGVYGNMAGTPPYTNPAPFIKYIEGAGDAADGTDYIEFEMPGTTNNWCVIYPSWGEEEEVIPGATFTASIWSRHVGGTLSPATDMKLEFYTQPGAVIEGPDWVETILVPILPSTDDTWEFFASDPITVPSIAGGASGDATYVRIVIAFWGNGTMHYDDYRSSLDIPFAWAPTPQNDQVVDHVFTNTNGLSWQNPIGETITATTVYFSQDPNHIWDEDAGHILAGVSAGDTNAAVSGLVDQTDYYWGVKLEVTGFGTARHYTITGSDKGQWHFRTGDAAPVLNFPWVYTWLDAGTQNVTLNPGGAWVIDDGKSPINYAWDAWIINGGANVVWDANDIESPTITVTATGDYEIALTATDAENEVYNTMHVIVADSPCDAVKADPLDLLLECDKDEDCDCDIDDFNIVLSSYLDCMSTKLGCTP